jgi:dTDP-4-amino-4,6-dideoxygalactose transaminase
MTLRHLPPTAIHIHAKDLWQGLRSGLDHGQRFEQFQAALLTASGSHYCFLVSAGRAALAIILTCLKKDSNRTQVVIPAYVCPTVVQSVLKAGLEPIVCDVSPQTLDHDRDALNRLINPRVLAVVPAHLYGWAQDIRDIVQLGKQHEFYVIEDAAQAFGASLGGRMVGGWGDVGYYSLGRGKGIPVGHGGVIITQGCCAAAISAVMEEMPGNQPSRDFKSLGLYFGYGLATRPLGWWFLSHTRWNPADAGMNASDLPPISIRNLSKSQAGIGLSILERIHQIQMVSKHNAHSLMDILTGFDFVSVPELKPEADPVFLRLPIILAEEKLEKILFDRLQKSGCGVSRSYWRTIPEVFPDQFASSLNNTPGATHLARCLLTLPTHAYLRKSDFDRIAKAFRSI